MQSSVIYFVLLLLSIGVFIAVTLHINMLNDHRMYDFCNVMIAALCPFSLVLFITLLTEFTNRANFNFSWLLLNFPPRFANLSIGAIFILFIAIAISNGVLILHEGIAVKNTIGTILELVWIIATIFAYVLVCIMQSRAEQLNGIGNFICRWIPYYLYCLIGYGECVMLGIMIMGWVAAHGKSKYDKDYIIIPGCCISKTGRLLPLLRGRVNRAVRYAWEQEIATGKPVKYIPSGGQGPDEIMSEGSAMALYLLSHSAEENEVIAEKLSNNTAENFLFSADIIKAQNPKAGVAFATTNYHVLRCGMLAKRAGLVAQGLGSRTKWYFWPNGFAREIVAIVNMTKKYHICAVALLMIASVLITMFF